MEPIILDGKRLADKMAADLKIRCDALKENGIQPKLRIVTTGDDDASKVYVRNKEKRAEEIGIEIERVHFDRLDSANQYYEHFEFNDNVPTIIQMPVTGDIIELESLLYPLVDVDGFNDVNTYLLASGQEPFHYPCTPKGIIDLLDEYNITIDGASVLIIGRSNIVGRPLARMMEQRGATVTLAHSHTPKDTFYREICWSDIVVCCTGVRDIITKAEMKEYGYTTLVSGTVFVDVGMCRDDNGKLRGEVGLDLLDNCRAYTKTPGGTGPMTCIELMENTIRTYENGWCT